MLDGHLTRLQRIRLLHQLGTFEQGKHVRTRGVPPTDEHGGSERATQHTRQSVGSKQAGPLTCGIPTQGIATATALQYRKGAGAYLRSADAVLLVQLGSGEVNMQEVRVEGRI